MRILLDVTRTLAHAKKTTPTGIDRVEHAYIRFLLKQDTHRDVWFIVNTPFGRGALSRSEMQTFFSIIEGTHKLDAKTGNTPGFVELVRTLAAPISGDRTVPLTILQPTYEKDSIKTVAAAFLRGIKRYKAIMAERQPAVYLHTSHSQLDKPQLFRWIERDFLFPVFFIHDLIPIEFPEYCVPGAEARHKSRVDTSLRLGKAIIVNSQFTKKSLESYSKAKTIPPIAVIPLANSIQCDSADEHRITAPVPFFLHVGTIEGRKNIGHLLNVWRHVVRRVGNDTAPRLVLIGKRGWECENVISVLDRSRELANYVIEVSGISDRELSVLMRNASGLLSVSMTEGYGLPPIEAVRMGLPVVASDIPAHREILKDAAHFVSTHDGSALVERVLALMKPDYPRNAELASSIENIDWDDHVRHALEFVEQAFDAQGRTQ
jgi:glycosyltransferase involved in cell wall biosynthesis